MRVGLGFGVELATTTGSASPPAAAPGNLLRWSEVFDNAAWLKTTTTVIANDTASPTATLTADLLQTLSPFGTVRQISATVAAVGAGDTADIFDVATEWTRYSVTSAFDGLDYTFSVYLKQNEAGIGGRLRIDRFGGLIRCSIEDLGDVGAAWAWGAQLEQAASASTYVARTT